ncbi:MAG: hypothetical protein GY754_37555 [bacterium]|nr:hypothetical protein [bacterium]
MKIKEIITVVSLALNILVLVLVIFFVVGGQEERIAEIKELQEKILKNQRGQTLAMTYGDKGGDEFKNSHSAEEIESMFRSTLRDIVREEFTSFSEGRDVFASNADTAENAGAQDQPEKVKESPELLQKRARAFEDGKALLSSAKDTGSWTMKDSSEMINYLQSLSPDQQRELTKKFHQAINRGEINPADPRSILF